MIIIMIPNHVQYYYFRINNSVPIKYLINKRILLCDFCLIILCLYILYINPVYLTIDFFFYKLLLIFY